VRSIGTMKAVEASLERQRRNSDGNCVGSRALWHARLVVVRMAWHMQFALTDLSKDLPRPRSY
jgi:hypothetical protein